MGCLGALAALALHAGGLASQAGPPVARRALSGAAPKSRSKASLRLSAEKVSHNQSHNHTANQSEICALCHNNMLPHAADITATEALMAMNATLYSKVPFKTALAEVNKEQIRLIAKTRTDVASFIKAKAEDTVRRAQLAVKVALGRMPATVQAAGLKRLQRTLYDRMLRFLPAAGPGAAPAPGPAPGPAGAPALPDPVNLGLKDIMKDTVDKATGLLMKTHDIMHKVTDKYTMDGTEAATDAAWELSYKLGSKAQGEVMQTVPAQAQNAFVQAIARMESASVAAAQRVADPAAFTVSDDAVAMAAVIATDSMGPPVARTAILSSQKILGRIATNTSADTLNGEVDMMRSDKELGESLDKYMGEAIKTAPQTFETTARTVAKAAVAQLKATTLRGQFPAGAAPAPFPPLAVPPLPFAPAMLSPSPAAPAPPPL